jgi:type IV secretory pathway VirB6-like protein
MSIDEDENIYLSKINEQTGAASTASIDDVKGRFYNACDPDTVFNYYNLTNYSFFLKNNQPDYNNLKFRLEIPNKYNNRENLNKVINVDISKLSVGKHHFVYRLDTISGNITLFVDGKKITNITFDPAEYALENTLYNIFNVGAATYFGGTILNNYIKQNGYYFCRNMILEQPRLFNIGVDDIDIKFLNLLNLKVGELIASLPCGQRNQVEQIQRFFKWQIPGNKSNNINIRVKSNILTNDKINQVLKEIIRRDISNSLPASVNINDIIFETH